MTTGEMIKEIYNSTASTSPKAKMIGSITGSGTINISNTVEKFSELTNSNFLIVVTVGSFAQASIDNNAYCTADGFTPTLLYNKSSGILSVDGLSQRVHSLDKSGWDRSAVTQLMTANIYLI